MLRRVLLLLFLSAGCSHPKPPVMAPAPQPGCLKEPPPKEQALKFEGPPVCPDRFVGCLRVADALALEQNIKALRRYTREAWARCGASPPVSKPK
jgi:hypothetical protein